MTSQSRRKRLITAKNSRVRPTLTKRWTTLSRAALFAGALAVSVFGAANADELAPRRFIPDDNARELRSIADSESAVSAGWNAREKSQNAAFEMTTSGNTLRWRVKQPGNAVSTVSHSTRKVANTDARPTFAERARQQSRVQNASALEDPFGDRKYAVRQAQAAEEFEQPEPMDFNAPGQVEPQPLQEEAPSPRRPEGLPLRRPAPAPLAEEPMEPQPMEDDPGLGIGPMLNKYNDRNCAVDGKACDEHRTRIKSDILINKNDLLDITAPLVLESDTDQQRLSAEENFKRIPVRQWRNRAGQVLATGRLREVAYRYAIIDLEDGGTTKIKLNQLGDDEQCFLAGWWNVPSECILGDEVHPGRDFVPSTMTWTASALCHKPLYFEEVQLERYGHTAGLAQPVLSGAHFFINIAFLPYHMGINPPNECQYALGYYRPGSCAPWMVPPIPLSVRGAAAQAAAVGIIAPIIP